MGKDFDWKETDLLVEQLRAKLAEDPDFLKDPDKAGREIDGTLNQTAPTPPTPVSPAQVQEEPPARSMSKKAAKRAAARQRASEAAARPQAASPAEEPAPAPTSTPASVPEPAGAPVVTPAVAEPAPETTAESTPAVFVPDAEEEEADPANASVPKEAESEVTLSEEPAPAPKKKPKRVAYRAGTMPPPSQRNSLFASVYNKDDDEALLATSAREEPEKKPVYRKTAVHKKPRNDEERRAAQTVDDLLLEIFGSTEGWSNGTAAPAPTVVETEIYIEEDEAELPPVPASTDEISAPPSIGGPDRNDDAVAREEDGQMTLVLPETEPEEAPAVEVEPPKRKAGKRRPIGTAEGRAHRKSLEDRIKLGDDGQIDLFSMLSMGGKASTNEESDSHEEEALAREHVALKKSVEDSDEDFRLLMELDYENELGNAIGFDKIREYHEFGVNGQETPDVKRRRRGSEIREFEVQGQDTVLRKRYTKQKKDHVVRLCISLFLTLLIFLYEGTNAFGAMFGGPFDGKSYPVSYILIGIQLLVIMAYFSWRRLCEGFLRLIRFSPIDYSLCSVMLIVTLIYHVVLAFLPHETKPNLYLSPAAVSLVLLTLADLLDWYRESLAFQVVSSRKQKYALIPRVSVGGEQGDARVRLSEGEGKSTVWYARPVGFVRNYFANTDKLVAHSRTLGAQLLLIVSVGVAVGLLVLALGGTVEETIRSAMVAFLLCAPTTSLLVTSLPMFLAACLRLGKRSAIIGEAPIHTCDGPTTLVMPDNEVFSTMHHERFELIEDTDIQRVAILVRALLEKLQSPLCESVNVDRDLRMNASGIELTEIAETGVSATADEGKINLLMGNMAYMQQHGIRVQPRSSGDYEDICRRMICVAVDHKVSALFLARYRLNENMIELLHELEEADVQVMVRTKDPGVHNELLARLLPDRKDPLLVMKPSVHEMDLRTDRVDATIVALGSCKEAARTFVTCRRIRRARHFGKIFQALSVGIGALMAGMLAILSGPVGIPSVLVSLYLLLWCGIHAITSYFYLREKNEE